MKKLILTIALLSNLALAWQEDTYIDRVDDSVTYISKIDGFYENHGKKGKAVLDVICFGDFSVITVIPALQHYTLVGNPNYRFVGAEDVKVTPVGIERGYSFWLSTDDITGLSNSQLRLEYRSVLDGNIYTQFDIPNIEESKAYQSCVE